MDEKCGTSKNDENSQKSSWGKLKETDRLKDLVLGWRIMLK
jgi:hypothetical protein